MLEDFFTLTEMKDGISTVARIEELVSEIQKLKDAVTQNKPDLLRQCLTAANTLAVTNDEECLQRFVQLDGVGFLSQWLKDAQSCSEDVSGSAEDLMLAILTTLESLPDSTVQAASCGVVPTVQHLLAHANTEISQKARVLCQKWNSVPEGCPDDNDMDTEEARQTDQLKVSKASEEAENGEHGGADEAVVAEDKSNGSAIVGDTSVSSAVSHGSSEKLPSTEEISAMNDVDLATNGMLRSDSFEAKSASGQVAQPDVTAEGKSPEPNKPEDSFLSRKMDVEDQNVSASSDDTKKDEPSSADMSHSEKDAGEDLNHLVNVNLNMHDSSDEERFGKEEAPTSSSDSDAEGAVNEYRFERCMNSFGDSSKAADTKSTALNGDKSTSIEDYDDTDALEVARLVAIEVEREVIDYREPFCDSPDTNSHDDSPELLANQQPEPPIDESNDNKSSTTGNGSGSSSSLKEDGSGITDDTGPFSRKHTRSTELEDFDLNENQCPEETDWHTKSIHNNSVNLSTPIAVAASRASSVFPARLHFEGEHGWKGSAATSAFRPASPRRNIEGDKSILPPSSQKTSNMFDLNFTESDDAIAEEPLSAAILPASGIASKGTSAALAASWGLELDLNGPCGNEESAIAKPDVQPFWNRELFTGTMSQPPSSSSSRQPAVKNFDLNDNMSHMFGGSSRGVDETSARASGKEISGHSEVTILGKRIVVGQQEHRHQIQHNFLGPSMESRVHTRPMQSYAHAPPSADSYPYLSALSYQGPMMSLGGGPYMVDARGAPVMQPLLGSGVGISHPSFSSSSRAIPPPPTELSYFHPSMGFNYGPSSEGARREEGGYWPVPYQGQNMFVDERMRNMSQGGSTSSSGLVPKRKEPDSGWDLYSRR
ncbi:unnamed protein product [Alopecurus aequalis]